VNARVNYKEQTRADIDRQYRALAELVNIHVIVINIHVMSARALLCSEHLPCSAAHTLTLLRLYPHFMFGCDWCAEFGRCTLNGVDVYCGEVNKRDMYIYEQPT